MTREFEPSESCPFREKCLGNGFCEAADKVIIAGRHGLTSPAMQKAVDEAKVSGCNHSVLLGALVAVAFSNLEKELKLINNAKNN